MNTTENIYCPTWAWHSNSPTPQRSIPTQPVETSELSVYRTRLEKGKNYSQPIMIMSPTRLRNHQIHKVILVLTLLQVIYLIMILINLLPWDRANGHVRITPFTILSRTRNCHPITMHLFDRVQVPVQYMKLFAYLNGTRLFGKKSEL